MKKEGKKSFLLAVVLILGAAFLSNIYVNNNAVTGQAVTHHIYPDKAKEYPGRHFLSTDPNVPMLDDMDKPKPEECTIKSYFTKALCDGFHKTEFAPPTQMPTKDGYKWQYIKDNCWCGKKEFEEMRTVHWKKEFINDGLIAATCTVSIKEKPVDAHLPVTVIINGRYEDNNPPDPGLKLINAISGEQVSITARNLNGFHVYLNDIICSRGVTDCTFKYSLLLTQQEYDRGIRLKCLSGGEKVSFAADVCFTGSVVPSNG